MKKVLFAWAIAVLILGCGRSDWKTTDMVTITGEMKSPNGEYIATVFQCAGGGAAGYTYANVNLRKATDDFSQREFLLGKYLWHSFKDIEVSWKDSSTLQVSYAWASDHPEYKKKNNQTVPEKDGVRITYTLKQD